MKNLADNELKRIISSDTIILESKREFNTATSISESEFTLILISWVWKLIAPFCFLKHSCLLEKFHKWVIISWSLFSLFFKAILACSYVMDLVVDINEGSIFQFSIS